MQDDIVVVSGFAENPHAEASWFGGRFLSCGRSAFGKLAASMRADDPASLDVYWDNWLCKKQRAQLMGKPKGDAHFFKLIQDVPRGGPHPRTSTTLPPRGGGE